MKRLEYPIVYEKDETSINRVLFKMQIKTSRSIRKMTQKDISDLTGLSMKCVSDIESFKSGNPTLTSIIKYLDVLGYELMIKDKQI